jgi:hypothetical protein
MTIAMWADVLQVAQGVVFLLLLIVGVGVWRQKTESAAGALGAQMTACRERCDAKIAEVERQAERVRITVDRDYARKDTIGATLAGMDVRLANIERALRISDEG